LGPEEALKIPVEPLSVSRIDRRPVADGVSAWRVEFFNRV
jgi:hypothetical protein